MNGKLNYLDVIKPFLQASMKHPGGISTSIVGIERTWTL